MMRWMWYGLVLGGLGCSGTTADVAEVDTCDVSLSGLAGQTWVMYEAMPDKSSEENPMARVNFYEDEGQLKAKYTAKHPFRVWDYDCTLVAGEEDEEGNKIGDDELQCFEEERLKDWCNALQAHEWGSCTSKKLKRLGSKFAGTDDELKELVREAKKEARAVKAQGEGDFKRWQLMNNNLGNHIQNRLYVKRDSRDCRLTVTDMYFTIHNGKGREDTNPVGINPFVKTSQDYVFEHCDGEPNMAPYHEAEAPKKMDEFGDQRTPRVSDTDIYYHYVGKDLLKPEKDCTYSFDSYSQYKPAEQNVEVTTNKKGQLSWVGKTSYPADDLVRMDNNKIGLYHMARYKQCEGGEREQVDMLCAVNLVQKKSAAPKAAAPAADDAAK